MIFMRLFFQSLWFVSILAGVRLSADTLDQLSLGDTGSETGHQVFPYNASVSPGGKGQLCRRIGSNGFISFTLACHPSEPTYLTVKLWGSDRVSGTQYLYWYDPDTRIGAYQTAWPELTIWNDQAPFPGRFVYCTYLLPDRLTEGRNQVTLKLADAELGIYRVYTHLEPFFNPEGEIQGKDPGPGPIRPAGARSQYDQLVYQANLGIAEFLTWQKYGPVWNAQVAAGTAPSAITGAVTFDGRGGNSSWTKQQWKEDIYQRFTDSNLVSLQALEAYGIAYVSPWSDYYHNPEMVDRIVKGLDFFRVAQGANGGFGNPWGLLWIGGPDRVNGAHPLEGFGLHALADAYLMVHDQIDEAVLNTLIDEDDNPDTSKVTRRTAWVNLFKGMVSHMQTDRGHAPNQDRAQVHTMTRANQCLKLLSPEEAWPDSLVRQWIYQAMGAGANPVYGGYWESQKGLALEVHGTINGGYCGNYGPAALRFIHSYGEMTGGHDAIVNGRFVKEIEAFANFVYPDNDRDGYRGWVNESVISWRPNKYPAAAFPGPAGFNGLAWAALHLDHPTAIRILQEYIANRRVYQIDCSASAVAAHYADNTLQTIKMVDVFKAVEALPAASARLPMECEPIFAWADEQAGAVAVRHNGARWYMTLNWRHDYCSNCSRSQANAIPSHIARIHYTTDTMDRIANVAMQTPYGMFKLYTCRYGDYLVAMNLSETETYSLDISSLTDGPAVDLIESRPVSGPMVEISPRTTLVLYPGRCLEFLAADINQDCSVDMADLSLLTRNWLDN